MDKKYCLGLYEKAMPGNLTMAEKLTAAREAGYDYLEMSVDETCLLYTSPSPRDEQ